MNGRFLFSNRNCSRIPLIKIQQIFHLTPTPHFLGSHICCSPILIHNVIALSIAVSPLRMFHLAFAASIHLFTTRANFEDQIIKFGGLQFFEQKYQPLNLNVNC